MTSNPVIKFLRFFYIVGLRLPKNKNAPMNLKFLPYHYLIKLVWKMHFFSQSADALLRYEDHFSLKKCSGESVEEKVAGNVKENWNSKFVLKFNDIRLQKLRFFQKSQFFTCIMTLKNFLPQLHQ